MEERKAKWYANKKVVISLTILLAILVIGTAFAYYYAILKGENINTASMADASLIYTEPAEGIETKQMSDYDGMKSEESYDFTITGSSNGTTSIKYGIYAEEEVGNTIDASQIKVYLTDENDIPYGEYVESVDETWYTPDGTPLEYSYGTDYKLEYDYEGAKGTVEGRGDSLEDILYLAYARDVLNLEEGESFYINEIAYDEETEEEREECSEYTYRNDTGYFDEKAIVEKVGEAEASLCNASFGWSYDETTGSDYVSLIDNEGISIVKITFYESNAQIIEDGEEKKYESIDEYLAEKASSSTYYVKNVYAFEDTFDYDLQGLPENLPSYCTNQNSDIVEDSKCDSAYQTVVGRAVPKVLSEKLDYFDPEIGDNTLLNPIEIDVMSFKNGEIAPIQGKGDLILEMRHFQNPRQYKLRYWVSEDATANDTGVNQEVTTTDEGKSHTVQFSSSGTFKFKVNVYAIQR